MKKKEEWEKREIKSASLSLKKTKSLFVDRELIDLGAMVGLGGYSELNKEFLAKECNQNEKEFEEGIWNFILKNANIKDGEYAGKFRKFLAEKIESESKRDEQKKRMKFYVQEKEYL